jgi:hypothetical protein
MTHLAYRHSDHTFLTLDGDATPCDQDTHQFESDAPAAYDTCACGAFYFLGAQLDQQREDS